jgi:hypothetical protein
VKHWGLRGAFVTISTAIWLLVEAEPAAADDCKKLVKGIGDLAKPAVVEDCIRTGHNIGRAIGVVLGTAAVGVAIAGLPRRPQLVPPRKPDDRFKPRDEGECGEELRYLDGELNRAEAAVQADADQYSALRLKKTEWEATEAGIRSQAAFIRSRLSQLEADAFVRGATFGWTFVTGMAFWSGVAAIVAASGAIVGAAMAFAGAWGIRLWRGYEGVQKMIGLYHRYQEGVDIGIGVNIPTRYVPTLRAWTPVVVTFLGEVADVVANISQQFDQNLSQFRTATDQSRATADQIWQRRDAVYQQCTAEGHLPAGTWRRPAPSYTVDSEGAIIGVS